MKQIIPLSFEEFLAEIKSIGLKISSNSGGHFRESNSESFKNWLIFTDYSLFLKTITRTEKQLEVKLFR